MKDNSIELPPLPAHWEHGLIDFVRSWGRVAIQVDRKQRHLKEKAQLEQEWSMLKSMQAQYGVGREKHGWNDSDQRQYGSEPSGYIAKLQEQRNALEQRVAELERLCDETYVAEGADAYHHACGVMEQWQQARKKAAKEVGTTGSLCDGIAWLYGYIDRLESNLQRNTAPTLGVSPRYVRNPEQPIPAVARSG